MSTKEYNLSGFTRIQVKFAMDLDIVRSDTYSIITAGNDTQLDNLNVAQEGDRLTIGYSLNLKSVLAVPFSRMHARITLPDLREFSLTGAAHATIKGFTTPNDFDLFVAGASQIEISEMSVGNMKCELNGASRVVGGIRAGGNVDLKVAGASRIDLRGSAQDVDLDVSGASHIELDDFPVRNAKVRLVGASHSIVNASGKLDVRLDGASRLEYEGQPTLGDVQVTGASSFKKR
jgi:Putative auto-transporter adhesin, head GIN domain